MHIIVCITHIIICINTHIFLCMTQKYKKIHKNTHINVCIHKYKHSYMCNYVLSSDRSPLRLDVNKKTSRTLSALA